MGAVSVPKLNVILNLICHQYHLADDENQATTPATDGDNAACQTAAVHSLLANFMLYAHLLSGTLCAISSPRLGALSDRYGRCYILAFTALGMLLGDIITLTAATFPDSVSVYWVLVEYAFGGLAGSFIATMAVIQSYAADCTLSSRRSQAYGFLHGCMYAGIAMGPVLGGLIIKARANDIRTIFYVAFGCHLAFILSVLFVVPESLSRERQIAAREKYRVEKLQNSQDALKSGWNWYAAFMTCLSFFRPLRILAPPARESDPTTKRNLILLAACDTVVFGVTLGSTSLVVMYSEYAFHWGNFESSLFVSIANSCRVAVLVIALPLATRLFLCWLGRTGRYVEPVIEPGAEVDERTRSSPFMETFDIFTIRISILFDVLGYLGYALAPSGPFFILAGIIASAGGVASPTLQSALTTHVSSDRTGELLGAVSLLHALSRIVAPAVLHFIYGRTVGKATTALFWCLVGIFGAAFGAAWGIRARSESGDGGGRYEAIELVEEDE
jgi:MFS family permease